MHMKDDHMRNAQLKPGYNIQIGVDSEYIVATDVFSDRNDVWTLIPFFKKAMDEKILGSRFPVSQLIRDMKAKKVIPIFGKPDRRLI